MKSFLETWRDVAGYEGLYQVSDFGEVRSLDRLILYTNGAKHLHRGAIIKPVKDRYGYLRVELYKDGKGKWHKVHRLVAQAFIPNPYNLPEINHINEDKTSNVVTNLEYCDHRQNINHGTRNQRVAEAMTNGKLSKKPIQLTLNGVFVKEWSSVNECGRNGFNISCVSACCRNEYCKQGNVYKGYRWMFAEVYYSIAKMLSA